MRTRKTKGFTLIELMITVAVVGILTAIALPAYQDYVMRSQVSEAILLMEGVKADVEEQYAQQGDLAAIMTNGGVGLRAGKFPIRGKYSTVWTINGAIMTIMNGPDASKKFSYSWVKFTPKETGQGGLLSVLLSVSLLFSLI